jgi:hypothetical protein
LEEPLKEFARARGVASEVRGGLFHEATDMPAVKSNRERHWLDKGKRVNGLRVRRGGEQSPHTAI